VHVLVANVLKGSPSSGRLEAGGTVDANGGQERQVVVHLFHELTPPVPTPQVNKVCEFAGFIRLRTRLPGAK
jgi:hypothetical protein